MKTFDNCLMNAIMFLITITISVYIIQLMQKNIKETEERFFTEEIINIHSEDEGGQYLYKFNLDVGTGTVRANNIQVFKDNKLPLKNIIAMFPISNDIVYILDSKLQLYQAFMNNTAPSKNDVSLIDIGNSNRGRPVKVVTSKDNIYILTDKGFVLRKSLLSPSSAYFTKLLLIKYAIDIAVNSENILFFLTNRGELYEYNGATRVVVAKHPNKLFTQIVSNRDTELVYAFGSDKNIYEVSYATPELITALSSFNIRLMCCENRFARVHEEILRSFNTTEVAVIDQDFYKLNIKNALLFGTDTLYLNTYNRFFLKDSVDDSELEILDNTFHQDKHPFQNMTIFTGTSLANIFVLVQDRELTCPPNLTSPSPNPNCLDLCIDTDMNDPICVDIFDAISSLINNPSSCPP